MRRMIITALLAGLALSPFGYADGEGEQEKAPAGNGEQEKQPEKPPEPKADTPLSRLLGDLRSIVARERSKPRYDEELMQELDRLVRAYDRAKEESGSVSLEDLSEADRAKLEEEVRRKIREEGAGGGGPGEDWAARERERRVSRALEGVELTDEQRGKVEAMLGEFQGDCWEAQRNGEVGRINDLKKDLEKRLRPVVGNRKARDIINNVNRQLPGRGRGR